MAINKLDIDEIISVIHENVKDPETKKNLIEDIKKIQEEKQAEKDEEKELNGPKAKNKYVIFIRGDESIKKVVQAGWIAKVPQDSDNSTLLSRIQTAAARQNDGGNKSGRGRKSKFGKIVSYMDFFSGCKRKHTKEVDIQPIKDLSEVVVLTTEDIDFSKE